MRHEPARTLLHLSPFYMLSRLTGNGNGILTYHFQQHGMLVIDDGPGRQYLNWSYMRETFVDEVANWHTQPILPKGAKNPPPLVTCKPEPHFARKLPWFSNAY